MATVTMNNWDLIVATRQGIINTGLKKLYPSTSFKESLTIEIFGQKVPVDVDVTIAAPQIEAMHGTGQQTNITFPITVGYVDVGGTDKIDLTGAELILTTSLVSVEAELQPSDPKKDGTNYDLIIDLLNEQAIVDVKLKGGSDPSTEALLALILKEFLQKFAAEKHKYKVASFNLGRVEKDYPYVVPHLADFTFVRDEDNVDNSTFAVLMLTTSTQKGYTNFNTSMIPDGKKATALLANAIFMNDVVKPGIVDSLKKEMKDPSQVSRIISQGNPVSIQNNGNIDLNQDHDPWISTLDCHVADNGLCFKMVVKANATFLEIHIEIDVDARYGFELVSKDGQQTIDMKQIEYHEHHSTSMEWWKWLLGWLMGVIEGVIISIIYAVVEGSVPTLGASMFDFASQTVTWPYEEEFDIEEVDLPTPVQIVGDPKLLE